MKTAKDIIATGYAPDDSDSLIGLTSYDEAIKAQPAILSAAIQLYEVATKVRAASNVTEREVANVLLPAMKVLQAQIMRQLERSLLPAIEKPAPSVVQIGEDKAADFLRAANSGAAIHVKQFE